MIQEKTKENRVIRILQEQELVYSRVAEILHCSPKTVSRLVIREKIPTIRNAKKVIMLKSPRDFLSFLKNNNYIDYVLFCDEAFSLKEIFQIVSNYVCTFDIQRLYSDHEIGLIRSLKSITKFVHIPYQSAYEYFGQLPELKKNIKEARKELKGLYNIKKERNVFARPSKHISKTIISPTSVKNTVNLGIDVAKKMDILKQKFFPKDYYSVASLEFQFGTSVSTIEGWIQDGLFRLSNCVDPIMFNRKKDILTPDIIQFISDNQYEDYIIAHHFYFHMSEIVKIYGAGLSTLYKKLKSGDIPSLHSPVRFKTISYENLIKFFDEFGYDYDQEVFLKAYENKKRVYQKIFDIDVDTLSENLSDQNKVEEEEEHTEVKADLFAYRVGEIAVSWEVCITDVLEWCRLGYFGDVKLDNGVCYSVLKDFVEEKKYLIQASQKRKRELVNDDKVFGIQDLANILNTFPIDARGFYSKGFLKNMSDNDNSLIFNYSDITVFQKNNNEYQKLIFDPVSKLVNLVENIRANDVIDVSGDIIDVSGDKKEPPSYTNAQCNEHLRDSVVNTLQNLNFAGDFNCEDQAQINQYFARVYDLTKKLEGNVK